MSQASNSSSSKRTKRSSHRILMDYQIDPSETVGGIALSDKAQKWTPEAKKITQLMKAAADMETVAVHSFNGTAFLTNNQIKEDKRKSYNISSVAKEVGVTRTKISKGAISAADDEGLSNKFGEKGFVATSRMVTNRFRDNHEAFGAAYTEKFRPLRELLWADKGEHPQQDDEQDAPQQDDVDKSDEQIAQEHQKKIEEERIKLQKDIDEMLATRRGEELDKAASQLPQGIRRVLLEVRVQLKPNFGVLIEMAKKLKDPIRILRRDERKIGADKTQQSMAAENARIVEQSKAAIAEYTEEIASLKIERNLLMDLLAESRQDTLEMVHHLLRERMGAHQPAQEKPQEKPQENPDDVKMPDQQPDQQPPKFPTPPPKKFRYTFTGLAGMPSMEEVENFKLMDVPPLPANGTPDELIEMPGGRVRKSGSMDNPRKLRDGDRIRLHWQSIRDRIEVQREAMMS